MLELRTDATGSSSSPGLPPAARDWKNGKSNLHGKNSRPLNEVVLTLLPTPSAADSSGGPGTSPNRTGGMNLRTAVVTNFQKYQPAVDHWKNIYGVEVPPPTLPDGRNGNHRLNPAFSQWMMGASHVHLEPLDRKQRLQAIGNAVHPMQAKVAYLGLLHRMRDGNG